jgi:hypothetical protein
MIASQPKWQDLRRGVGFGGAPSQVLGRHTPAPTWRAKYSESASTSGFWRQGPRPPGCRFSRFRQPRYRRGIFPDYKTALEAWRGTSQARVDETRVKYVVVHLHRLLDPEKEEGEPIRITGGDCDVSPCPVARRMRAVMLAHHKQHPTPSTGQGETPYGWTKSGLHDVAASCRCAAIAGEAAPCGLPDLVSSHNRLQLFG